MSGERGRPRQFDMDDALDQAQKIFWRDGFQSASLSALTESMGINKPSMYAAFGDKETLYLKALQRYAERELGECAKILEQEADGRMAVIGFLRAMAELLTNPARPGGCFIVNGTADLGCSMTPAAIENALQSALRGGEEILRARIQRAQREGQLSATVKVADLAAVLGSVLAGMAVMAKGGAKRTKLNTIINAAMEIWPSNH